MTEDLEKLWDNFISNNWQGCVHVDTLSAPPAIIPLSQPERK